MKKFFTTTLLVLLGWSTNASTPAQVKKEPHLDEVVVTLAVAPSYPLTALHSHTSGEAVIEVTINSEGSVTSARGIAGSPLLIGGARYTAQRWKFAPTKDKPRARIVRLTFVYHLAPKDTPPEELLAVFRPPYCVEITHALPDETPLP